MGKHRSAVKVGGTAVRTAACPLPSEHDNGVRCHLNWGTAAPLTCNAPNAVRIRVATILIESGATRHGHAGPVPR